MIAGIKNVLHFEEGVWRIATEKNFEYNDGDEHEEYIYSVIKNADDISSDSKELVRFIKDWPSKYHLSIERSFAYRSLNFDRKMTVLEVGSGCGAITRFLGETGAEIVALEGSLRRAKITRERTRDLENVTVVCAPFDKVEFARSFDLVILNGVLEYSPLFVDSDAPFDAFLEKCNSLLSSSGALIIAIENQFGLRYFSSGKEDHTNVLYDGLHGYPSRPFGVKTFSRQELCDLVSKTVGSANLFLPIPDYKFPRALVKEELTRHVNLGELVADLQRYDFATVVKPKLHERLVYHELGKSNLIVDMSNSLFVIAGPGRAKLLSDDWLGCIFKDPSRTGPIKRVDIYTDSSSNIRVLSKAEGSNQPIYEDWIGGISVHTYISRVFCRRRCTSLRQELAWPIRAWWESLEVDQDYHISGYKLDAIWRNAKIVDGKARLFDQEFGSKIRIPVDWLIYRAVSQFYHTEFPYFKSWNWRYRWYPPILVMIYVGLSVNHKFSSMGLWGLISREAQFQKEVTGRDLKRLKMLFAVFCPLYLHELKRIVAESFGKVMRKVHIIAGRLK